MSLTAPLESELSLRTPAACRGKNNVRLQCRKRAEVESRTKTERGFRYSWMSQTAEATRTARASLVIPAVFLSQISQNSLGSLLRSHRRTSHWSPDLSANQDIEMIIPRQQPSLNAASLLTDGWRLVLIDSFEASFLGSWKGNCSAEGAAAPCCAARACCADQKVRQI